MVQAQYSLSWDMYKSNICNGFTKLQQNGEFVDMTLAADGHLVKVHQALIALSSPYLKAIINSAPCQHPVLFLNNISYQTLTQLLEYIYTGEVLVSTENFDEFTNAAKSLCIRGLESFENHDTLIVNDKAKPVEETLGQMSLPYKAKNIFINAKDQSISDKVSPDLLISKGDDYQHDYSDVMDDHGHDTDDSAENISSKKLITQENNDNNEMTSKLQYSVSIRGAIQIILNRYIYNFNSQRRRGTRRWRCIEYRGNRCLAFVETRGNIVLKRCNPHNHPFHDKKILSKIEKKIVYSALEDVKSSSGIEDISDADKSMKMEVALEYSDVDQKVNSMLVS